MRFNIANTVTLKKFSLKGKAGGTVLNSMLTLPIPQINVIVIHTFDDYETGQRGWGLIKDIVIMDDPKRNYINYQEFLKNSMPAKDAIQSISNFFQENSSHLDEYERRAQLDTYQTLLNWATTPMFKDNFLVFFSEFDVITLEQ
jgi:hypothetical protein